MSRCKACGADIIFIRTKIGRKPMPCDADRVFYGPGKDDKVITPNGEVISCKVLPDRQGAIGVGFTSHFATCPASDEFRRRK